MTYGIDRIEEIGGGERKVYVYRLAESGMMGGGVLVGSFLLVGQKVELMGRGALHISLSLRMSYGISKIGLRVTEAVTLRFSCEGLGFYPCIIPLFRFS